MSLNPLCYLAGDDVRQALPMADAIDAMREAFTQLAAGAASMPPRIRLELPEVDGLVLLMPCRAAGLQRMSLKIVHQFAHNRAVGLPLLQALVLLADATNGQLLALLDGAALTAIRTGAASGVATQLLARADADTAAIFGSGVQARTQLEAICSVRPVRRARVFDQDPAGAAKFAAEMTARLGVAVEPAASPVQALAGARIVCTATTSSTAVFEDRDLAPGAHINAVGSWRPTTTEIAADTVARARVFVDQREAALEEAGDLILPLRAGRIMPEHVRQELGDLLTGTARGRQNPEEITLFKSVGLAVQDLFAAARALANARRLGLGMELPR